MAQQDDMFAAPEGLLPTGLCWLKGQTSLAAWLPQVETLAEAAPWRQWQVPGGGMMSVESTNAGAVGWCSDRQGYRYEDRDPLTGRSWPTLPTALSAFATDCARQAGYPDFAPDTCLVNRYWPGARMGIHRDADELDFTQPIVSVSLGLPATFVWHGAQRSGRGLPLALDDGDVVIFGGEARRGYHQVRTVRRAIAGAEYRINLTFRKAR
jgi:alkylated DNA repair protein (DNA oxidative demethylase)